MPRVPGIGQFEQTQWAGGLNLRDAPGELDNNETPDCMNVTFDDTGAVVKRLGTEADSTSDLGDSDAATWAMYFSEVLNQLFIQFDDKLYKRTAADTYNNFHTFASAPGQVQFCDFGGLLYFVAPNFGVYSYNGTTATLRNSTVRGSALAAWQNRLWATGDGNTTVTRVWFSNIGDGNTWTTGTDFVDLRDGGDAKTTALAVSATGALLAFKDHSTHRITDSVTGANSTIDPSNGACGSKAVHVHQGMVCTVNSHGVYLTDGLSALQPVSGKLDPLFSPTALSIANRAHWCIGHYQDRFLIGLRRLGQTYNDLTLEFHPGLGWFSAHSLGLLAVSSLGDNDEKTYGITGTSSGLSSPWRRITRLFIGGDDDGDPIDCYFYTKPYMLEKNNLCRLRHIRVDGRGSFQFCVRRDYETGEGQMLDMVIEGSDGFLWGTGVWGVDEWGGTTFAGTDHAFSLGTARRAQFCFRQSGSASATATTILDSGPSKEIGEVAMNGFTLDYVLLGLA